MNHSIHSADRATHLKIVMVAMVVTINRLLWRPLYTLAATKYKLET